MRASMSHAMTRLFRDEVIQRRCSEVGVPLGVTARWTKIYVAGLAAAIGLGLVTLACGTYARKARVWGFLVPDKGLIKVYAAHAGRTTEVSIKEGDKIAKDQVLCVIAVDQVSALGRTQDLVIANLANRRALVVQQLDQLNAAYVAENNKLDATIISFEEQTAKIEAELLARRKYRDLARNTVDRSRLLETQGTHSLAQREKTEQELAKAIIEIALVERALAMSRGDLLRTTAERSGLGHKQAVERAEREQLLAELDQKLVEAEERRQLLVRAPTAGTVTRITAAVGSAADPAIPLVTIIPDGTRLEAYLYTPSSAVGFIKPGAGVRLRYEAYPYQKFGAQAAVITSISRTAVPVRELPFSSVSNDPLYVVTARLVKSTVTAFGREEPLQTGTKFQADIVLEKRHLWEWVIEPLLAAAHRL